MSESAISFAGVSKRFEIQHQKARSFQDALINFVHQREGTTEEFWALRDVSFDVRRGETLGIIGHNGSGKSTALKLVTRILDPTSGRVTVNGRVSALIELGAGFHPDLSGRENVYLNGSILGFSRREMDRRFAAIVEFSELERFIDTPVKHYSSGMYARLGFSVAISVDPDILIIDEVLAVGDEGFQRKCFDRIAEFRRRGKTIILVTHGMQMVERLCDRVIWLHQGLLRGDGAPRPVIRHYAEEMQSHDDTLKQLAKQTEASCEQSPVPSELPRITRLELLSAQNHHERYAFSTADPVIARAYIEGLNLSATHVLKLEVLRSDGVLVYRAPQIIEDSQVLSATRDGYLDFEFLGMPLLGGTYQLSAGVTTLGSTSPIETGGGRACTFSMWSSGTAEGIVEIAVRPVSIEPDRNPLSASVTS